MQRQFSGNFWVFFKIPKIYDYCYKDKISLKENMFILHMQEFGNLEG